MNIVTTCLFVVCCLFLFTSTSVAQYDKWYFGDRVMITTDPDKARSGCLSTSEGTAVYETPIYNPTNKEYYSLITDGVTVFDQQCRVIQNGSGLMGHASSTQSAAITPYPGDTSRYIIFTAGAGPYVPFGNNIGIRYSVVEFKPNPRVTLKNITLLDTATEKLVATVHCNKRDFWVLAHGWGDNKFYAWLVNSSGVASEPVVSAVGAVHSRARPEYTVGQMKISPNGRKIAVVTNNMNRVQLLDFDNSTGVVSNPIDLPAATTGMYAGEYGEYGASFSPNNTRLYISGITGHKKVQLSQFTITGTPEQIVASEQIIFSTPFESSGGYITALQLAAVRNNHRLEGRIYCVRMNSRYLGVIMQPDLEGLACNYIHDGYDLDPFRNMMGLPNCIDAYFNIGESCSIPRAQTNGVPLVVCQGSGVNFYDASLDRPTSWKWLFPGGTPSSSTERDPTGICYDKPGTYDVTLIATNEYGSDTALLRNYVTVKPRPIADAGSDRTLCKGSSIQLQASGGSTYEWTPATGLSDPRSASPVASPEVTTEYIVKVSDKDCENYDTVLVTVLDQLVAIEGEYRVCRGDTVWHDAGVDGMVATYRWEPETGVSDPAARRPTIVANETTRYRVIVAGEHSCSDTAVVVITVLPKPDIDAGENMLVCRGATVLLEASGSPGTYVWEPKAGLSDHTSRTPSAAPETTTTYRVTVTDGNGCHATDSVTIFVEARAQVDAGEDRTICLGRSVRLEAVGTATQYRWEPAEGLDDPFSATPVASPMVTTTYRVTSIGVDGCTGTDEVTVSVLPLPVLHTNTEHEICEGNGAILSVQGSEGDITWEPSAGVSDIHSRTPFVSPQSTTVYTVTLVNSDGCSTTASIRVIVLPKPTVTAGRDTIVCSGNESILSAVGGIGTYRWEPAGTVVFPDRPVSIARPQKTTMYTVTYTDEQGCAATDSMLVQVEELADIQAVLPAIDGPVGMEDFRVPIVLRVSSTITTPVPVSVRFTVSYDRRIVEWTGISNGTITKSSLGGDDGILLVTIDNITPVAGETVIAELIGTPLLAKEDFTVLDMEELTMTPPPACGSLSGVDGSVQVVGVCFAQNIRRFEIPRIDVTPNPASDILEIRIHNTNGVTPLVQFLTLWGEVVPVHSAGMRSSTAIAEAGTSVAAFDVSSLVNGIYYVAVEVDGIRFVQPVCIVK